MSEKYVDLCKLLFEVNDINMWSILGYNIPNSPNVTAQLRNIEQNSGLTNEA